MAVPFQRGTEECAYWFLIINDEYCCHGCISLTALRDFLVRMAGSSREKHRGGLGRGADHKEVTPNGGPTLCIDPYRVQFVWRETKTGGGRLCRQAEACSRCSTHRFTPTVYGLLRGKRVKRQRIVVARPGYIRPLV